MTRVHRPYSRLYWEILDDPKFREVYDDDAAFACWTRLLMAADMAWPASATLPHGVKRGALAKLVTVGLVDLQTGTRYRIHGLDRERAARSRQASDAAAVRWSDDEPPHPASSANGMRPHPASNAQRMPSRDEPRRDKESRDEHENARAPDRATDDGTWAMVQFIEQLTDRPFAYGAGAPVVEKLREDVRAFGAVRVEEALRQVRDSALHPVDGSWVIHEAHKVLMPLTTGAERKDAERRQAAADREARQRERDAPIRRAMGYDN